MATQRRGPRHPNPARARKPKSRPHPLLSPVAYLERRGSDVARLLIERAHEVVADLQKLRGSPLSAKERKRALKLATGLLPYLQRVVPLLAGYLEIPIRYWEGGMTSKRGRRLQNRARFAKMMLHWSAGELGARDLPKLRATELMALAVVSGLEVSDGDKRAMLDSWRKLLATHAPANPEAIAEKFRKSLALEKEIQRLEALRKASEEQTFSGTRRLSDYLALGSSSNEELEDLNLGLELVRRKYEPS